MFYITGIKRKNVLRRKKPQKITSAKLGKGWGERRRIPASLGLACSREECNNLTTFLVRTDVSESWADQW